MNVLMEDIQKNAGVELNEGIKNFKISNSLTKLAYSLKSKDATKRRKSGLDDAFLNEMLEVSKKFAAIEKKYANSKKPEDRKRLKGEYKKLKGEHKEFLDELKSSRVKKALVTLGISLPLVIAGSLLAYFITGSFEVLQAEADYFKTLSELETDRANLFSNAFSKLRSNVNKTTNELGISNTDARKFWKDVKYM